MKRTRLTAEPATARRLPRAALAACLAACAAIGGCAESSESPEVLVERGHLMESRGEFQRAIDAYSAALKSRPDDASAYYDRGVAFGRLERWDAAVEDYTRAVEHDPSMARAYNNRAAARAQQRKFELAVADFTRAIALDSKSALSYRNRGLAYHDLGQFPQSIEDYTVSIRLEPNAFEGHFERGNAFLDAGEYQKAVADYDRALALDSKRAAAWLNRAEAHRRLGNTARAQADVEQAERLEPRSSAAQRQAPTAAGPKPLVAVGSAPSSADPVSARERATQVAADYLAAKGYRAQRAAPSDPFELICEKGASRLRVEVQTADEPVSTLRFTRAEIEAARRSDLPTALVVVGKVAPPASPGGAYSGGTVVRFIESWKPSADALKPAVYEYALP